MRGDKILSGVFTNLCKSAGTLLAWKALQAWEDGDFKTLVSLKVDPFFYTWNARYVEFEVDYQIVSFFSKYQDFDLGIDREAAAFEKWLEAERSCQQVNQYFRDRWCGRTQPLAHAVEEILHLARRKVAGLLGTVKPVDMAFLRERCKHGPGSDLSLLKRNASAYDKFRTPGDITEPCARLYDDVFGAEDAQTFHQDLAHNASFVVASRLSFVAKNALIDRAICVSARWNVFLQLGIGSLIEKRLRPVGIRLERQQLNQDAARFAYVDGTGTVDLRSASDSVSTNLVIDLLSEADPIWLDFLLKTREPYTEYKGKRIRLEKISSMGNGYTFPLESLIFYAFTWATCRFVGANTRKIRVYGDDLVLPREAISQLIEVLGAFGFVVNTAKTYASGDFFESCGNDFFRGREVRPFFVKRKVRTLFDAMKLHNQIVEWSRRNLDGCVGSARYSLCRQVLKEIPKQLRYLGPLSHGGVFHAPLDSWLPSARRLSDLRDERGNRRLWVEGFRIRALVAVTQRKLRFDYYGHLYSKLSADMDTGITVNYGGSDVYSLKGVDTGIPDDFVVIDTASIHSSTFR